MPKPRSAPRKWAAWLAPALVGAIAWHSAAVAQPAPGAPAPKSATSPGVESAPARPAPASSPGAVGPAAAGAPERLVTGPTPGPNAAIKRNATAEIHEEDLLLLSADLDNLTVTDALPAYGQPDDPLLPVGELARLLDLNITVAPAEGQILGRIGQAERSLTIDLANGVYRLSGTSLSLAPDEVAVSNVDIYIKTSALQRILPIVFKADAESLLLKMHALEKLPIQARLDRLAELRNLRPDTEGVEQSLRVPTPYSLFSMPGFDFSGQVGASQIAPRFTHSYDIRMAGDLLFTGFQGYIGSDQNGQISSARATFERHDIAGKLLGPIHATSASAGDVYTPSLAIGARSVGGRGFSFSTAPLEQTSVFNRIDLRGELPVGYDVELYINDILRSGQRTPVNGRYEFLNVPLVRGVNVIRIVTNGPRGERSEETRIVNVSGGQVAKGSFNVEMGVVQQDIPLINIGHQDPTSTTADIFSPGHGKLRVTAAFTYGLTDGITMVGGFSTFPALPHTQFDGSGRALPILLGTTVERQLLSAGIRTSFMGAALQIDAAADSQKSGALAIGVAAQPFGIPIVARQVFYEGAFIDETVGTGSGDRPIVSHSEANMDFNVQPFKQVLIPLSLRGTYDYFADKSSTITGGFRASGSAKNILLSGGVDLNATSTPGSRVFYSTTGNFSASTFYQFKWQLRASLDYTLMPTPVLNALTLTADRDINERMAIRLGVGRQLTGGDTNFQLGNILHTRLGDLSINGSYATPSNQWTLGMSFAMGMIWDPLSKRYLLTRPGPASGGAVAFQAFVDNNGDGIYDKGDKPVSGVTIDGGEHKGTTDSKGQAVITGVGSAPTGRIQIGLDQIDDPYVVSPPHTVSFNPRPGRVIVVPYPLTAASEIITHVMLRQGEHLVGISAVRVRVVKPGSNPIEASTEFDGSAGFEALGPGTYDYQLDPEQAERLHMHLVKPVKIVVPTTGGPLPDVTAEVVFDRPAATDATPKN